MLPQARRKGSAANPVDPKKVSISGISSGAFMANQLHIAQNVVNAVLYAFLAAIVGVVIVAVGGGGISAMKPRWEAALEHFDQEKGNVAGQVKQAPSVKDQAKHAAQSAQGGTSQSDTQQF